MCKKYFILLIPLIALIAIGILSGNVYSLGHFKDQSGIGGSVEDCNYCHEFDVGFYENPGPGYNLRWVRRQIEWPPGSGIFHTVKFTKFSDSNPSPDGTLADGNDALLDGACEVCHTQTSYHKNTGDGTNHYDANNCTACHPHFTDDVVNYFSPTFVGGQSHFTHFTDPKGPQLGTDACFTACHLSSSDFRKFKDNKPIETTNVCDACHSSGGSFNGVGDMNPGNPNSVAYGAKYNWEGGIYEPAVDPEPWPSRLKAGKENWCAGCHDNGSSVVKGVSAPNVMGDNVKYGYNVTGHGRDPINYKRCGDCHDLTAVHTDGNARTYSASLNNYQSGYRLRTEMAIPRFMQYGSSAFRLCLDCHIYSDVFGPKSDFRQGDKNLHEIHLGESLRGIIAWDSDWETPISAVCSEDECADSAMSCTACHNVHGSPCLLGSSIVACDTPLHTPMIRHGELISTPGTQDKVPALKFNWYDGNNNPTTNFDFSGGGGVQCCNQYPSNLPFNHVCWGCHQICGEVKYYRLVTVKDVWTTDTSNTPKTTFHPGDSIRYHVSFTVSGQNPPYYIQAQGVAQKTDGTGPKQTFLKSQYLALGTYEWTEDKLIPSTIVVPPEGITARITITVGSFSYPGGSLLAHDAEESLFSILP